MSGFALLRFHQFYKLDDFVQLFNTYQSLNKDVNLAYAYCDFSQVYNNFASLIGGFGVSAIADLIQKQTYQESQGGINFKIEDGKIKRVQTPRVGLIEEMNLDNGWSYLYTGRLLSRVSGMLYFDFFPNLRCILEGAKKENGKTWYDLGFCSGKMISVVFDVTIG